MKHTNPCLNRKTRGLRLAGSLVVPALLFVPQVSFAQDDDEIFELSPFTVEGSANEGYRATSTLAGTRIRTNLEDVGSSISVLTEELLEDVGATDNQSALVYAVGMEVAGPRGNFSGVRQSVSGEPSQETTIANANANTRVRGLTSADNTRNYFLSDAPWDGYNVSRVDLQRGPNAILFGLGSPAGVVNASTDMATVAGNEGEVSVRFDQFGSLRGTINYNHVVLPDELAVRVAVLRDDEKFRQKPAYEEDERFYIAATYKPRFLNSGDSTFTLAGNYEIGDIESNRPRATTPLDYITPWWDIDQATFNMYEGNAASTNATLNRGIYDPWVAELFRGGLRRVWNSYPTAGGAGAPGYWERADIDTYGVMIPDPANPGQYMPAPASNNNYLYGASVNEFALESYNDYAVRAGLENADFTVAKGLSDPSVFDFYNNLLDGRNKKEWSEFETFDVSVSQTFLGSRLGYEVAIYDQKVDRGQYSMLGWQNDIWIDLNETQYDGTPNPNVGRAYVNQENFGGNNLNYTDRRALRAQVFGEYDFRDSNSEGFLPRLLGKHRLTGVYVEDERQHDSRQFMQYGLGADFLNNVIGTGHRFNVPARVNLKYYISDDLRGASSPSDLGLDRIRDNVLPQGGAVSYYYFDTTWNNPNVDPGDPWTNPGAGNPAGDPNLANQTWNTQARNPANYVGWTYGTTTLVDALDGTQASMDLLTRKATLSSFEVDSNVVVWQGFFWDDSVVGTFGYRKDKSKATTVEAGARPDGGVDVSRDAFNLGLGAPASLETETKNWSVVAHLHKLLGEDRLPMNLSLFYNRGENFEPAAGRLDVLGGTLAAPEGETKEYGLLVGTKDNRYSLRLTRYETAVRNATSTADITNFFVFQQTMEQAARAEYAMRNGTWGGIATSQNLGLDIMTEVLPAWEAFVDELDAAFPTFAPFWLNNGTWNPGNQLTKFERPASAVFTEDAVSKGYELELVANPFAGLRLAANASKTEAIRDNVPGSGFVQLMEFVNSAWSDGNGNASAVGDMPFGWGSGSIYTNNFRGFYNGSYSKIRALNGRDQPDVRKWRANLIANYDFRDGPLQGFGVGGSARYQDSSVYAYPIIDDANGNPAYDIDNGYETDSNTTWDFWVRYGRALTDDIDWSIQANLYNAFGKNELVPISGQPDGSPGAYAIREGTSWAITNTFSF